VTSVPTNRRAVAVAATPLAIIPISAPAVSARPNQSPRRLTQVSPGACQPASRARSVPGRASHDASARPHRVPIISVALSRLPRTFITGKNWRGAAIVKVATPVSPANPSILWMILRKAGPTGLIVSHTTSDRPPARSRHAATHKFSSGPDRWMLKLLRRWLRARVFEGGIVSAIERAFIGTVARGSAAALRPAADARAQPQRVDRRRSATRRTGIKVQAGRSRNVLGPLSQANLSTAAAPLLFATGRVRIAFATTRAGIRTSSRISRSGRHRRCALLAP
jgi:hypothetical protein